ncbi:glycosyl hydrolase family 28-related protein [Paenibacillus sp. B01]|uniref:glycosyl hydrolase family 28-related protein n=1 Tax=Paenibacillus sp. B01 TaxID=2660554 RepID=UPI00129BA0A7|nr:glycosyl hydrolase family 28-related protein [Paenibacillus sp. B01]QGG55653.1 S-layer protein [Paenibacillus sp. B01]
MNWRNYAPRKAVSALLAVVLAAAAALPHPAPAKAERQAASVALGERPTEDGIRPRAGDNPDGLRTGTLDGKGYWETDRMQGTVYLYMDVDDGFLYDNRTEEVYVTAEVYDEGKGKLVLQYDSDSAPFKDAPLLEYGDSGTWKSYTFKLADARLANRTGGADFRLGIEGGGASASTNKDVKLASVTVTHKPKPFSSSVTEVVYTQFRTEDVVIADHVATDYGAAGDGLSDDTAAIQLALDTAGARGGGVVFLPAGRYRLDGSLTVPTGVTLRGDWTRPDDGGGVRGTVLEARGGRGEASGDSLIRLAQASGVTHLSIWYPEQDAAQPVPYPWSIEQLSGDSATVRNVTLVNAYNGIKIGPSWNELHYVKNVYGTVLGTGIFLDYTTDIGRLEGIRLSPEVWAESGLPGAPARSEAEAWTTAHAEGIVMGRSDWEYMSDIRLSGFKTGLRVTTRTDSLETANAQFYDVHVDKSRTALKIEGVNDYGLLVSASSFAADQGPEPVAIHAGEGFHSIVQFNDTAVGGRTRSAVVNEGSGVLSFENSIIGGYDEARGYGIEAEAGSLLLGATEFEEGKAHVRAGSQAASVRSLNSGHDGTLDLTDGSESADIRIDYDAAIVHKPLPVPAALDAPARPKPPTDNLYNIAAAPYGADNTGASDASGALRQAMQDAAAAGGGTVFAPAGRYRVDEPVVVPSGVELRGSWDVPHHTIGGGTVLFTNVGENDPDGEPFLSLEAHAGVRGLNIYYDRQDWTSIKPYSWTVQGRGEGVYLIDVTFPDSYQAVDFGSYDTSGHYIDYAAGSPLREGIRLGGGAKGGIVRNVQFNPHYAARSTYPNHPSDEQFDAVWTYQKEHLDAFRVGDVQEQTLFNTFVYGSLYGIHMAPENGRGPEAIVIGHGTDGSKKGAYLEAGGPNGIAFINTELVSMSSQDKAYIETDAAFASRAEFYNSSMWGDTTRSAVVGGGSLLLQQSNFTVVGEKGVSVLGGSASVLDSYFQQAGTTHLHAGSGAVRLAASNNLYNGGLKLVSEAPGKAEGIDILPVSLEVTRQAYDLARPERTGRRIELGNFGSARPLSGTVRIVQPSEAAAAMKPVRFEGLELGAAAGIDLPHLAADRLTAEVKLDGGKTYTLSGELGRSYAVRAGGGGTWPALLLDDAAHYSSVGGKWRGKDDLSVAATLAWDDDNLYVDVDVKDDAHVQSWSGGDIWQGDSLQLGVDLARADGAGSVRVNELGFALGAGGAVSKWRWRAPQGGSAGLPLTQASIERDEAARTTSYRIALPFSELYGSGALEGFAGRLGFSLLVNENDGQGRAGFMEYHGGIGKSKDAASFGELILLDRSFESIKELSAEEAVRQAERAEDMTSVDAAANFVALLQEGPFRQGLEARLEAIGGGTPTPSPSPSPSPSPTSSPSPNPSHDPVSTPSPSPSTPAPDTGAGSGAPTLALELDGSVTVRLAPQDSSTSTEVSGTIGSEELAKAFELAARRADGAKRVLLRLDGDPQAVYSFAVPSLFLDGKRDRILTLDTPVGSLRLRGDLLPAAKPGDERGEAVMTLQPLEPSGGASGAAVTVTVDGQPAGAFSAAAVLTLPWRYAASDADGSAILARRGNGATIAASRFRNGAVELLIRESGRYAAIRQHGGAASESIPAWAKVAAQALRARGIDLAQGGGSPATGPVSRGSFLAALVQALDLPATDGQAFSDVPSGSPLAQPLTAAAALGIASGTGGGRFEPDAPLTRQDASVLLDRALSRTRTLPLEGASGGLAAFSDGGSAAAYAGGSLGKLIEAGWLKGSDGMLRPGAALTGAEAAVLLQRMLEGVLDRL